MVGYYDLLLIAIPVAMGLGTASSVHPAVTLYQGLGAGSVVSALLLVEAIFRNPPVEPTAAELAASALVFLGWTLVGVLSVCGSSPF